MADSPLAAWLSSLILSTCNSLLPATSQQHQFKEAPLWALTRETLTAVRLPSWYRLFGSRQQNQSKSLVESTGKPVFRAEYVPVPFAHCRCVHEVTPHNAFFFFFELCITAVVVNICISFMFGLCFHLPLEKASGWFLREDFCHGPSEMSGLQQILSELCPGSWSLLLVDGGLWMLPTCAVSQIYYLIRHIFSQLNKCWVCLNRNCFFT